ncbi:MAG: SPOR domain-containing protein [Gammaproteobacteria bacterium]
MDSGNMIRRAALAALLITLYGCVDPEKDWELASRDDSPETYLEFLAKHPDTPQADLARERIQALKVIRAWERAEYKDSEETYFDFIKKYPDSEFAANANARIAEIERDRQWEFAQEAATSEALSAFVATYPEAPQRAEADEMLEELRLIELAALEAATPKERPGDFRLQLAAFRTPASAEQELRRLVSLFPTELLGPVLIETPADRDNGRKLFLLKTAPMTAEEARATCDLLKSRKQQCMVINK